MKPFLTVMNIIYTIHSGHYHSFFINKITLLNLTHTEIAPFNLGSLGHHNLGSILAVSSKVAKASTVVITHEQDCSSRGNEWDRIEQDEKCD